MARDESEQAEQAEPDEHAEPDEQAEPDEPAEPDEQDGQDEQDEPEEPSDSERLAAVAEQRGQRLQDGRSIGFFGGTLPLRALIAAGIFVAVFLAIWALLWQLGVGLGLGWLPALAAGAAAVWLYAERLDAAEPSRRDPTA